MHAKSFQSCLTLCNPLDCSPQGFSVHGILQTRILEWVTYPPPGDLPDSGMEPTSPAAPALQVDSLPLSHLGACRTCYKQLKKKEVKKKEEV